ncbi:hypothetical protein NDU88_001910 [Pleurodeles waltl]|uniref:Uncharacterized protein n=1 Tax=Pleurodeles waltl TaxID=8319 RepID=A0AAV7U9F3_PLEWA|nr:hypothetical protein NDU88_001910 [Pleurodeles waltl]
MCATGAVKTDGAGMEKADNGGCKGADLTLNVAIGAHPRSGGFYRSGATAKSSLVVRRKRRRCAVEVTDGRQSWRVRKRESRSAFWSVQQNGALNR